MGLFSNTKPDNQSSALHQEIAEVRDRFFAFIDKLKQRTVEFTREAIPELVELNATDTDEFKREYHRMKSAVVGQLKNMQQKANEVLEEKITNFNTGDKSINSSNLYGQFRNECYDRYNQLDKLIQQSIHQVEETYSEDFELKYQKILDEYEAIKNNFHCTQCNSLITIPKIFFTTTYLTCPSCQTKNTFEPSSQAKQLENIARSLAEQRTRPLLKTHDELPGKIHSLYLKRHELEISLIHEKNQTVISQKKEEIARLEREQQKLEQEQPVLYQKYLRAMFDEWNKINPDLMEEHERFYSRLLNENKQ